MKKRYILMGLRLIPANLAALALLFSGRYQWAIAVALTPLVLTETFSLVKSWRGEPERIPKMLRSGATAVLAASAIIMAIAMLAIPGQAVTYLAGAGILAGGIMMLIGINLPRTPSKT